ncbi:MAG: hypothetical protein UX04_C0002G0201 [Microgenomates group bacterium GW2011_GWF2_45_18]|nr:MAG: hypothetical protein UX04_C0002G0201 [Microgenomates group bacterium GW2011_GWF2_45_18]
MKKLRQPKEIKKPTLGMSRQSSNLQKLFVKNNIDAKSKIWNLSDKALGQSN